MYNLVLSGLHSLRVAIMEFCKDTQFAANWDVLLVGGWGWGWGRPLLILLAPKFGACLPHEQSFYPVTSFNFCA